MKRSPLKRGAPLRRTGWLKQRRPSRRPAVVAEVWREGLEHEVCVVCGAHGARVRLDGHHAVPKRVLIRRGFDAFVNDIRNRVPVCRFDHESHETRSRPIRREELPVSVFRFAGELGLGWYVDRHYQIDDSLDEEEVSPLEEVSPRLWEKSATAASSSSNESKEAA